MHPPPPSTSTSLPLAALPRACWPSRRRLWALARIEAVERQRDLGLLPPREASDAVRRGGGTRLPGLAAAGRFVAKCVAELALGTALFIDTAALVLTPAPLAHGIGFGCGAIHSLLRDATPRRRPHAALTVGLGETLQGEPR